MKETDNNEKQYFFDKPGNLKVLFAIFLAVTAGLFATDFFFHRHAEFPWEEKVGFYCVFAFVGFVGLVLVAKHILRPLVMRKEDYYDD